MKKDQSPKSLTLKYTLVILLLFFFYLGKAQFTKEEETHINELKAIIAKAANDTAVIKAYVEWDDIIYISNPELDLEINEKIIALCTTRLKQKKGHKETIFFETRLSAANINMGLIYTVHGDYTRSFHYFNAVMARCKEWERSKIIPSVLCNKQKASALSGIGVLYKEQGNYSKAIEYYFMALKLDEKLKNKEGIAKTLGNIGSIYRLQGDYDNALKYLSRALKLKEETGNKKEIQATLGNMGNVYTNKLEYAKALDYYFKARALATEIGDKKGIALWLGNIGSVYQQQDSLPKALKYYFEAIQLAKELDFKPAMGSWFGTVGEIYLKTNKPIEAKKMFEQQHHIAIEIGDVDALKDAELNLSELYEKSGKFKEAYEHHRLYIRYRDSVANEENTKKQTQLEMQYAFDEKQAADSIKNVERANLEDQKHQTEIKHQKIYTYGGVILFGIMLIVATVSFRAFRNKQRVNLIIAEQKLIVEEKQREIIDSIHYAKRIQQALLPSEKMIKRKLKEMKK